MTAIKAVSWKEKVLVLCLLSEGEEKAASTSERQEEEVFRLEESLADADVVEAATRWMRGWNLCMEFKTT